MEGHHARKLFMLAPTFFILGSPLLTLLAGSAPAAVVKLVWWTSKAERTGIPFWMLG